MGIITIVWDLPDSDGDSEILNYEVWWDDGAEDGNFVIIASSTGNALTFTTSTSLVTGNSYSFLIRAVNAVGASAYSDQATVIAGTIPGKNPTPIKFSASTESIEIRWSEASDGGSIITDYNVFWDNGVDSSTFVLKGSTGGYLTFTVPLDGDSTTVLIAGRTYSFKVSAVNGVGEGPQSDTLSIIAATKPDKPPTPTLVYQSPDQINIEWTESADGGSEITNYIILADIGGTSFAALIPTTGTALTRSYAITESDHSIVDGTIYNFKVVAVNAVDESEPSDAL